MCRHARSAAQSERERLLYKIRELKRNRFWKKKKEVCVCKATGVCLLTGWQLSAGLVLRWGGISLQSFIFTDVGT